MLAVAGDESEHRPEPRNYFDEALDLGALPLDEKSLRGYVGEVDRSDYYRFEAASGSGVRVECRPYFKDYKISLYRATNISGDSMGRLYCREESKGSSKTFEVEQGGAFYIGVEALEPSAGALYTISLSLDEAQ